MTLPAESFAAGPFGRAAARRRRRWGGVAPLHDRCRDRLHLIGRRGERGHPAGHDQPRRRRGVRESRRSRDTGGPRRLATPARRVGTRLAPPRTAPRGRSVRADWTTEFTWSLEATGWRPVVRRDRVPDARHRARLGRAARATLLDRDPRSDSWSGSAGTRPHQLRGLPRAPLPAPVGGCRIGDRCSCRRRRWAATLAGAGADARWSTSGTAPGRPPSDRSTATEPPCRPRRDPDRPASHAGASRSATRHALPPDWVLLSPGWPDAGRWRCGHGPDRPSAMSRTAWPSRWMRPSR